MHKGQSYTKFSRVFYDSIKQNLMLRRVFCAIVLVKHKRNNSAITDYTHAKFASIIGVSEKTARRYYQIAQKMGWVRKTFNGTAVFRSFAGISPKSGNVNRAYNINITRWNFDSIKTIEDCFLAQQIVEIQLHKDWIEHKIEQATNGSSQKAIKAARKELSKRGINTEEFVDNGISYDRLIKDLRISPKKVCHIITKGVIYGLFSALRKIRNEEVAKMWKERVFCKDCFDSYYHLFFANRYTLCYAHA